MMDRKTLRVGWVLMRDALKECGIDMVLQEMTQQEFLQLYQGDNRLGELLQKFQRGVNYLLGKSKLLTALAFTILLSVSKSINEKFLLIWMKRRMQTFGGAIGSPEVVNEMPESAYPLHGTIKRASAFYTASHQLFSTFFKEMYSIALTGNGFIMLGMREVIEMMRGHGMQHPEFLNLDCLQDLPGAFERAIETINRLDKEKNYFTKILYDKDQCSSLNRKNFTTTATVAIAIARYEDSTFEHFYSDDSKSAVRLASLVTKALEYRKTLLPINVGELSEWRCGPKEIKHYDDIMLSYLKKELEETPNSTQTISLPFMMKSTV